MSNDLIAIIISGTFTLVIVGMIAFSYINSLIHRKFSSTNTDWVYASCLLRWCRVGPDNIFDTVRHYPILRPGHIAGKELPGRLVICRVKSSLSGASRLITHKAGECPWCIYMTYDEYDSRLKGHVNG